MASPIGEAVIQSWTDYYDQVLTTMALASVHGGLAHAGAEQDVSYRIVRDSMTGVINGLMHCLVATTKKPQAEIKAEMVRRVELIFRSIEVSA